VQRCCHLIIHDAHSFSFLFFSSSCLDSPSLCVQPTLPCFVVSRFLLLLLLQVYNEDIKRKILVAMEGQSLLARTCLSFCCMVDC
jgi:hypothetical protein